MEDLQLQVAMYNIVFQVYADKVDRHNWVHHVSSLLFFVVVFCYFFGKYTCTLSG